MKRLCHRFFPVLAVWVILLAPAEAGFPADLSSPPKSHIVFLMADDLFEKKC